MNSLLKFKACSVPSASSFHKPIQTTRGHGQQRQNKHSGHIKTTVNCESVQTDAAKVTTDNANALANQRARNNVTTAVAH